MVSIADEEIEAALERMFVADVFKSSPKLRQFLRYIVAQKLNGKDDQLKAYTIAIDVYNYPTDFDPQNDPIIRVQARRLRAALTEYYLKAGADEVIKISVPRGSYRPMFSENLRLDKEEAAPNYQVVNSFKRMNQRYISLALMALLLITGVGLGWFFWGQEHVHIGDYSSETITIAMRQDIRNLTKTKDSEDAISFTQGLRSAMARNSAMSIIMAAKSVSDKNEKGSDEEEMDHETDFIIDTSILGTDGSRKISVELLNGHTNKLLWSRSHWLSDVDEETITQVVRALNSEILGASVQALEGRDPNRLSAQQLFVLTTWVPGPGKRSLDWEKDRIELVRLAIKKDPDFGPAYSVLASKLAYLAAIDGPSDTAEAATEAKTSAARALELSAGDENALFNLAQYYWHSGQLDNSINMMKRVLELNPSHGLASFFSLVFPYSCSIAPYGVLTGVIEFDRSLETDNPARWVTWNWLGWLYLNRGEPLEALEAVKYSSQISQSPHTITLHAVILNQLGRSDEADDLLLSHKTNWPNLDSKYFSDVTFPRICSDRTN